MKSLKKRQRVVKFKNIEWHFSKMLQRTLFANWNDWRKRTWNSYKTNNCCREHDENRYDFEFFLIKKVELEHWLIFKHDSMTNQ
jgi:hypothetical protein